MVPRTRQLTRAMRAIAPILSLIANSSSRSRIFNRSGVQSSSPSHLLTMRYHMPFWQHGVRFAARRLPARIGPATHAALDYAVAGSFLFMAARMWRRNRRAAVGSLLCGGIVAANALLTDYPGGVFNVIDYKTHAKVDAALAALAAAAPRALGFADDPEANFFSVEALAQTVASSLTDFGHYERI